MYTGEPIPVTTENNPTACFLGGGFGSIVCNIKAHKLINIICEQPLIIANIKTFPNNLHSVFWSGVPFSRSKSKVLKKYLDLSVECSIVYCSPEVEEEDVESFHPCVEYEVPRELLLHTDQLMPPLEIELERFKENELDNATILEQ